MEIGEGDTFTFTTEDIIGDETRVSVSYEHLVEDLSVGDRILVNNGLVIFEVTELKGKDAICKCLSGGAFAP